MAWAFWLAALISVPAFALEFALIARADILAGVIAVPVWRFAFYVVVLVPLIEESVRYAAVRMSGHWRTSPASAALVGALVGLFEMGFKSVPTGLELAYVSSLPIHIALSVAFFAFTTRRLPKTFGMHAAINLLVLALGTALTALHVGAILQTITLLAAITAASALFALAAVRRRPLQEG